MDLYIRSNGKVNIETEVESHVAFSSFDGLGNLFSWNPVGLTLSLVLLAVLIKCYETNLTNLVPTSVNQIKQSGQQNSVFTDNFTGSQDSVTTWGGYFW